MPVPKLVPVPPTSGQPAALDRSPFWIGAGASCALRIYLPGVPDRCAAIQEREDGFYLSAFPGAKAPRLNGRELTQPTKLEDGQVLEIAPAAKWEFVTGAERIKPVEEPEPEYAEAAPGGPRKRRRRRKSGPGFPLWATAAIVLLVAIVVGGGVLIYRAYFAGPEPPPAPPPLTQVEEQLYDSLMVESTKSIERGATLLDYGLKDAALKEFVKAIQNFEGSTLRDNPWVKPQVEALGATISQIYEAGRFGVPSQFHRAGATMDLSKVMIVRLGVDDFQNGVAAIKQAFLGRYRKDVRITGQDHAEHVSLYGKGGAVDVGVKELSAEQVDFLVAGFRSRGIRVKDFSKDVILRAQIEAAIKAGVPDRAGTGLHVHVDRFADRRDAYTVR